MLEKKWLIVLGIVNLLAAAGIIFWYVGQDSEPPIISVEEEFVYKEEMTDSDLLQGVSAMDGKDGDVSHTLVIEKVAVNHDKGIAVVTCGANDASGNIAKLAFRMKMSETDGSSADIDISPLTNPNESAEESSGEVFTLAAGEAANDVNVLQTGDAGEEQSGSENNVSAENENSQEGDSEEEAQENAEEDNSDNADTEDNDNNGNTDESSNDVDGEEDSDNEEETPQQAPVQDTPKTEVGESPVLAFGAPEVITTKGKNPAWVTVISQLQDNKDSYEDLLGNLKISGEFTNANVGSYDVMVSTVDSDGNESAARAIRITVTE